MNLSVCGKFTELNGSLRSRNLHNTRGHRKKPSPSVSPSTTIIPVVPSARAMTVAGTVVNMTGSQIAE